MRRLFDEDTVTSLIDTFKQSPAIYNNSRERTPSDSYNVIQRVCYKYTKEAKEEFFMTPCYAELFNLAVPYIEGELRDKYRGQRLDAKLRYLRNLASTRQRLR